jgi:hypothetical protein
MGDDFQSNPPMLSVEGSSNAWRMIETPEIFSYQSSCSVWEVVACRPSVRLEPAGEDVRVGLNPE